MVAMFSTTAAQLMEEARAILQSQFDEGTLVEIDELTIISKVWSWLMTSLDYFYNVQSYMIV